jgi:hypothetical protein
MNCLQVRAGHGKNVCGTINERVRKRLALQAGNISAFFRADLDCIEAGWLTAHRMHPCRDDFNILSVPQQMTKQPFCDGAAADITCTDKENAFHNSDGASERDCNVESNRSKSICKE